VPTGVSVYLPIKEVRKKYYHYLKENYDEIFQSWMKTLEKKVPDILSKLDNSLLKEQSYHFMDKIVELLGKDISLDFSLSEFSNSGKKFILCFIPFATLPKT
jgi:hypothetical protein